MGNKLELTWYGKEEQVIVEPRLLIHDPSKDYGEEETENMLIHGDNLLALKALEKDYTGQIKCVYIDPPYNTGSAFEHYDDNMEHSQWLSLIKPRLELLRRLLQEDGSIWISIDDDEGHYLKVLCDEVFGRSNFVSTVIWEKKYSPQNDAKWLSDSHDFIIVYAKNKTIWESNLLPRTEEMDKRYKNPDEDPRGPWKAVDLTSKTKAAGHSYCIETPSGRECYPSEGRQWAPAYETYLKLREDNRLWFGVSGNNIPALKTFLSEVQGGMVPKTIWFRDEVGDNQDAKKENRLLGFSSVFDTPKPERLIERILTIASNQGDLVLDSFLGSGTTAAVAQKMKRRWIGIEMGEHAYTHCKTRLDKVIDGEDQGGISKAVNWTGGGGYKFYELAPSLINFDKFGEPVINKEYNADMLAAAVALHEGYTYQPDKELFWKQAYGTENSYLFVTTRHLTDSYVNSIMDTMTANDFLIIACRSFDEKLEHVSKKIAIKKIPQMLLSKCEFDKEDYNLNIVNPPAYEE